MRILLDGRLYGLENAGLGRYTIRLLEELVKIDNKNEYVILLRKKYFDSLAFPSNYKKILADFRHYSLTEQIRLPHIISRQKPDIVHFLHMNVPILYRKKFVVTVHDLLMQKHRGARATTLPFYSYFSKLIAAKYVFRNAVLKSEKIIVPSKAVRDEVVNYYKISSQKITPIYEGASSLVLDTSETGKILQQYRLKKPYLIYSGNAYPHKNLERAILAIKLIREKGIDLNFYITSSRSIFTKKLEALIHNEKAGEYVKFLGFIEDTELGQLFKESAGFLYPSLSEGFGLQGLEAMKSGTLVLASDIPVFREIYKEVPIYFDPYNLDSIKKSIEALLSLSSKDREKRISKGIALAKKYSWTKMAKETLEVYESLK